MAEANFPDAFRTPAFAFLSRRAALAFDECTRRLPDYIWCLLGSIASYMAADQKEQAQTSVKALIKADPEFSLEEFADMFAESDLVLLQNAGVP